MLPVAISITPDVAVNLVPLNAAIPFVVPSAAASVCVPVATFVTRPYESTVTLCTTEPLAVPEPVVPTDTVARSILSELTTILDVDAVPTSNALPLATRPAPAVVEEHRRPDLGLRALRHPYAAACGVEVCRSR